MAYRTLGILLAVIPGAVMAWIIYEGRGRGRITPGSI
jgi:hypothetical protein